ncbi:MAG: ABC transporter ATP-binding protein [Terriglobia bacterium]
MRQRLAGFFRPARRERFCALRDVTFSVGPGESLAIIGHNGAGKSTLLNLASRLCNPSEGVVTVEGKIAPLLELGAGFHMDLTGAENVRVNAALLGLTRREFHARFDDIVEFAEVGAFIDAPLRTYSTGMLLRLAFAVAVNIDPDILIIDEVLGVGDEGFFQKCLEKIIGFRRAGKALVCVSHSMEMVQMLCDQALWLEGGEVRKMGPVNRVVEAYRDSYSKQRATADSVPGVAASVTRA